MTEYMIAEVAARTGFTTSALRYYDDIGLVRPTARSDAGYRLYDDRAVERIELVRRVKGLGLTLDDARAVAESHATAPCADVQDLLTDLVRERLARLQQSITEDTATAARLQQAAALLAAAPPDDGPCDADCVCDSEPTTRRLSIVGRGRSAEARTAGDDVPQHMADWQRVLGRTISRVGDGTTLRLGFPLEVDLAGEIGRLCAAEHECCSFFTFGLAVVDGRLELSVSAPPDADDLVATVFGVSSRQFATQQGPGRP